MVAGAVYSRRIVQLVVETKGIEQAAASASKALQGVEKSVTFLKNALIAFGLYNIAGTFKDIIDATIGMNNILGTLNLTTAETVKTQQALFDIANDSRTPVDAVTKLFVRLDVAVKGLGFSQKEVLGVTEAVTKGLQLGGASAGETASAVLQLSQAFASGRLQGDEFRAVLENAPVLAQTLAHQLFLLGKISEDSLGALRKASAAGALDVASLAQAFLKGLPQIQEAFAKTQLTVGQFFNLLYNESIRAFDKLNDQYGILTHLSEGLRYLADNITELSHVLIDLAEVAITRYAVMALGALITAVEFAVTASLPAFLAGLGAITTALGGWPTIIAAAVVGLVELYKYLHRASDTADTFATKFKELGQDQLKDVIAQAEAQKKDLLKQIDVARNAPASTPHITVGTRTFAAPTSDINSLNDALDLVNLKLITAKTALDAGTDSIQYINSAAAGASTAMIQFYTTVDNLTENIDGLTRQTELLNANDFKGYEALKAKTQAYKDAITYIKQMETEEKRTLSDQEKSRILKILEDQRVAQIANADALKDYNKRVSDATTLENKLARQREQEAKKFEKYMSDLSEFHPQADLQQEIDLGAEKLTQVGLEKSQLTDIENIRKATIDLRAIELSQHQKGNTLSKQELDDIYTKLLLREKDNSLLQQALENQKLLASAAAQENPALGKRQQATDLQNALNDPAATLNMSSGELSAARDQLADIRAEMEGIGAVAEKLSTLSNPFAGLMKAIAQFHEAAKDSTITTQKQIELTIQGIGSALQFINDQASSLGIDNFEFQKALAISQAIINSALAVTSVLAEADIPFYAKIGLAGAIASLTAAQVSVIAAQQAPKRAFGGSVSAGTPYEVGERGPEMYRDTGGRQIFIPSAAGTVTPGDGRAKVTIINNGAPVRVVSQADKADGSVEIVVAAVKAVEDRFDQSMRTGQGSFSKSLTTNTNVRRQL